VKIEITKPRTRVERTTGKRLRAPIIDGLKRFLDRESRAILAGDKCNRMSLRESNVRALNRIYMEVVDDKD